MLTPVAPYLSTREVLVFINRRKQLALVSESMNVGIPDKELALAVRNGLPPKFERLIVALDTVGDEDESFSGYFVKSRLSQEEQRMELKASPKVPDSALITTMSSLGQPWNCTRSLYGCHNCGRNVHTAAHSWGKHANAERPQPPRALRINFKERVKKFVINRGSACESRKAQ